MMCRFTDPELGPCHQSAGDSGLCAYHADPPARHDRFYHAKILAGLLSPTATYLSDTETRTLFRGRARHDGRRLDAWTRL